MMGRSANHEAQCPHCGMDICFVHLVGLSKDELIKVNDGFHEIRNEQIRRILAGERIELRR